MKTIMIIAGESSGELYGSLLATALKNKWPDVNIIGIGGSRMQEAGVELISHISDAFGLIEAVSSLKKVKIAFDRALDALRNFRPEVLIPIDYPDFNLKVTKSARSLGIKILYYVSPQVWAWRKGRVKKIAGLVDRMAVILPFEEKIYRDAGVECEFVGHPVLEEIEEVFQSAVSDKLNPEIKSHFKSALGLDPDKPLLSLLPGSRPSELSRHFPVIIDVIRHFRNDPDINPVCKYQFCIPLAPNTDEEKYDLYLETLKQESVVIRRGESVKVLAASDMAVVASGTATLQTALLEVPMVVMYKLSPLSYQLGKRIIKVKHISLVNLLSGKQVVKEMIQDKANPEEIMRELKRILFDEKYREDMIQAFQISKEPFSNRKASERVAEIVMEMAGPSTGSG